MSIAVRSNGAANHRNTIRGVKQATNIDVLELRVGIGRLIIKGQYVETDGITRLGTD